MRLAPWNWFKPLSNIFLLTIPRQDFFCGSFMLFISCVCYAFVRVCLLLPCCHPLGKGWPLGSRLWCLNVGLLLSHWYPGSGVVLDCIDSWSVSSLLLWIYSFGLQKVIFPSLHSRYSCMFLMPSCDFFSNLTFSKKSFSITVKVSNGLDPDQDRHNVCPDLGSNCLQMPSAGDKKTQLAWKS